MWENVRQEKSIFLMRFDFLKSSTPDWYTCHFSTPYSVSMYTFPGNSKKCSVLDWFSMVSFSKLGKPTFNKMIKKLKIPKQFRFQNFKTNFLFFNTLFEVGVELRILLIFFWTQKVLKNREKRSKWSLNSTTFSMGVGE